MENYRRYVLWQETEAIATTCVADEFRTKVSFHIIEDCEEEEEKFGEYMVSQYGSQDYGYQVDFDKIGTFYGSYLKKLMKAIEDRIKDEKEI